MDINEFGNSAKRCTCCSSANDPSIGSDAVPVAYVVEPSGNATRTPGLLTMFLKPCVLQLKK